MHFETQWKWHVVSDSKQILTTISSLMRIEESTMTRRRGSALPRQYLDVPIRFVSQSAVLYFHSGFVLILLVYDKLSEESRCGARHLPCLCQWSGGQRAYSPSARWCAQVARAYARLAPTQR